MLNPTGAYSIGIEIGMRNILSAVVDLNSKVVTRRSDQIADFRDAESVSQSVLKIELLQQDSSFSNDKIVGVGIAIPGLVDKDGVVVNAPFLGWKQFPLQERIASKVSQDWLVRVHNDASAFAAGEHAGGHRLVGRTWLAGEALTSSHRKTRMWG